MDRNPALLDEMASPSSGLATKTHKVLRPLAMGRRTYKHCFTGADAVSWLVARERCARPAALRTLQGWLDAGLLRAAGGRDDVVEDSASAHYQFASAAAEANASAPPPLKALKTRQLLPRYRGGREQPPPAYADLTEAALLQFVSTHLYGSLQWSPVCLVKCRVSRSKQKGKRTREHDDHFLTLCSAGASEWSLQLGRYSQGKAEYRLMEVWPLRALAAIDVRPGGFYVRLRRGADAALVMEYQFTCPTADAMMVAVLRACTLARATPKTSYEMKQGAEPPASMAGSALLSEPAEVSIDAIDSLESLQLTGDDLEVQQLMYQWMQQHHTTSALTAHEALEDEVRVSERKLVQELMGLDGDLASVLAQMEGVARHVEDVERWLDEATPAVHKGAEHIRDIRGHRARREREQRHMGVLVDTLQLLMASLSVPPRLLSILREPSFGTDDASDMVNALHCVDKVITMKDLDQRLLRMRAVSDRSSEYRQLLDSFGNALLQHCHTVLAERAASRAAVTCTQPPTPLHEHLAPFLPVFVALPRTLIPPLMQDYMAVAIPVYMEDSKQFCAHLLNGVRKREHTTVEGFAVALDAISALISKERAYWFQFDNKRDAQLITQSAPAAMGGASATLAAASDNDDDDNDDDDNAGGANASADDPESRSVVGGLFGATFEDAAMQLSGDLSTFLEYSSRHNAREVIGLQSVCDEWQSRNSAPMVDRIAASLNEQARSVLIKFAEDAALRMRESQMARNRTGPLQSFTHFPALLDSIHSYGVTPSTPLVCDRILTSMLEWLESPEVVKELIKFDSSKKTIYAGRLENYYFLRAVLETHVARCAHLQPYLNTCGERYESNLQSFMAYVYERQFESLHEYFTAVAKLMRTVPPEEIQFQVSMSRTALQTLNRRYSAAMWDKKLVKLRRSVLKNISANMVTTVWASFSELLIAKLTSYYSIMGQCYGPEASLAIKVADLPALLDKAAATKR